MTRVEVKIRSPLRLPRDPGPWWTGARWRKSRWVRIFICRILISQLIEVLSFVNQNVSEEETISMMKEYIEKVEKRAAEQENKENEKKREIRKKKEEQVQELIRMYSKKSTTKIIEPEKKGEILKELLQQYGKQKKELSSNKIAKDQTLAPESTDMKLKTTPRKISVSPRSQLHFSSTSTDSFEARNQEQEKNTTREKPESPESFNRKSSRPRPTTLKITLNYETDCDAITLD